MREASKSHQIRIKVGFLPRKPTLIQVGSNYGRDDTARRGLKRWGAVEVWSGCCGFEARRIGMALARFRRDFMAARCPAGGARTRPDAR